MSRRHWPHVFFMSVYHMQALGGALPAHGDCLVDSQAGSAEEELEDVSTSKEHLPQLQVTSRFPEALPSLVGPSFYMTE
eukprot:scaffold323394_cov19-Tisochrysis_lutea.AAC.1